MRRRKKRKKKKKKSLRQSNISYSISSHTNAPSPSFVLIWETLLPQACALETWLF